MSYVTEFYKAKEHDYKGFFAKFEENDETLKVKSELNSLLKLIEEKTSTYTIMLNKRYNATYTPLKKDAILSYTTRDNAIFYFDVSNGFPVSSLGENSIELSLDTKSGHFSYVAGYCYELGAVLVKHYKYSIPTNNAKVNLRLIDETLVPIFEDVAFKTELNGTSFDIVTNTSYNDNMSYTLGRVNATDFIQNFYGIDKEFSFSLSALKNYLKNNKSCEIIIKTCEDEELTQILLSFCTDKAVPLHELVGTTKSDWKYAEEMGVLHKFVRFKKNLNSDGYYSSARFKNTISKTDKEWIEFIEKMKHWEDDLAFYTINYRGDLFGTLIKGYVGGEYPFYCDVLPKYYPFGKFCSYVVEESINQGYTSIETFIKTLSDYIRMCADLEVTPTLYSSYLHQTHDIVARNHKIKLKAEQETMFASRYSDFKPYKDDEYTVVAPANSSDLQKEGDTLNHCVASYIKRVVDNECLILFLRDALTPLESLVTIEMRKNSIVQARGLHNRQITEKERLALYRFAKNNGYTVRV